MLCLRRLVFMEKLRLKKRRRKKKTRRMKRKKEKKAKTRKAKKRRKRRETMMKKVMLTNQKRRKNLKMTLKKNRMKIRATNSSLLQIVQPLSLAHSTFTLSVNHEEEKNHIKILWFVCKRSIVFL